MHQNAGRKQSKEHIQKRVNAMRASGAYARNGELLTERNKANVGWKHTEEYKAKRSAAMIGKRYSLGAVRSEEFRRKLSDYWAANREKHNHFVDGSGGDRNSARMADMGRLDYRLWREAVFKRDNWRCVQCGARGNMHADHIKPYSKFPELRLDVDNGRTMCPPCHRQTPTYGGRINREVAA